MKMKKYCQEQPEFEQVTELLSQQNFSMATLQRKVYKMSKMIYLLHVV